MGRIRQPVADAGDHGRIVEAAERGWHDQHLQFRQAEHEGELALAKDDHERVRHRAKLQAGEVEDREFPPVRQLERHDVALADAARGKGARNGRGHGVELAVADALRVTALAAVGDDGGLVRRRRHGTCQVLQQGCVRPIVFRRASPGGEHVVRHEHQSFPPMVGALGGPFASYALVARSFSRETMSFMIWAVPSPISSPITSRRRCWWGRSSDQP